MQPLLTFVAQHATLQNVMVIAATAIGLLTLAGNAVKALAPAGSKAAHAADTMLALALDVAKAKDAVSKLLGAQSSPAVPPPSAGPTAALLLCVGLALGAPARAAAHTRLDIPQPTWHIGPSVSLYELRLDGQVGQLAPGLGVQGWASWKDLDLGVALFGSALGLGTARVGAALSVAPYACADKLGLCIGPGLDLGSTQGGLLAGFTWKRNFFLVAQVLPQFWQLLHFRG